MSRIRVFVLLVLALSGVLCDVSQKKDAKRTVKAVEWKKPETKSTKEKRDSSELTALYNVKQKEEHFQPLYQYHYPGAPLRATSTRYVTAATTPQLSYTKPDAVIGIGGGPSIVGGNEGKSSTATAGSSGGIQYASTSSYKPEGGIHYASSAYKAGSNSANSIHYASSAYRGPFIATYQQAPAIGQVKVQPGPIYVPPPSSPHSQAGVTLPLHYGGFEQQLPLQQHQQNQYAIAFPAEYVRHYHQNLPAPFPLHGAHMVPLVYAPAPAPQPILKDQPLKQGAVHYITLSPQVTSSTAASSAPPAAAPTIITHFIPFYGPGPQSHPQQFQQQSQAPIYFGGHPQHGPNTFAYTALPPQQQTIQIVPKHQIYGPIQMAAVGAAAAATVPIIPFKPIGGGQQQEQQLQQPLHHYHHHHHPGATSYTRYAQSPSDGSGSVGSNSPIEVPASETSSSSSALKLGPLYSSQSSTSSGNIYAGTTGGGGGKMSYTYASDTSPVVPVYTHPGAMHYGTHLYHPSTKVIEIGSNRVTAGSAAIAGVGPPAYHPQQHSAASSSHRGDGGGGGSNSVVKFS